MAIFLAPSSVQEALRDRVDVVFHEAAMVGFGKGGADAQAYVTTNVIGTIRLMDAIAKQYIPDSPSLRSRFINGDLRRRCLRVRNLRQGTRGAAKAADLMNFQWDPLCVECGEKLEPCPITENQPPRPKTVYAITKLNQELICMSLGQELEIPVVALRYHNVYGPGMSATPPTQAWHLSSRVRLLSGLSPTIYEDGKQLRDFVHVEI